MIERKQRLWRATVEITLYVVADNKTDAEELVSLNVDDGTQGRINIIPVDRLEQIDADWLDAFPFVEHDTGDETCKQVFNRLQKNTCIHGMSKDADCPQCLEAAGQMKLLP